VRVDLPHADVDPRVRCLEQLEEPRERVAEGGGDRADAELPGLTVGGLPDSGVGGRRGADQRPAGVQEHRAGAGERDLPGGAVQQPHAEPLLEGLDGLAQRRL